jgi:competence protein ComEC
MKYLVIVLITFSATQITPAVLLRGRVVWNVGQGQWITITEGSTCYHFDMGGEFFPWSRLRALCGDRQNKVLLSHWDWDHIGALADRKLLKNLPRICILKMPLGKSSPRKMALLKRFSPCAQRADTGAEKIFSWQPSIAKNSNDLSQVFEFQSLLMPGDSPKSQEKIWKDRAWLRSARILILGHHGSRTSTSTELLSQLPQLKVSISSARWKRYSHPHAETVARLHSSHIPLLRTEDWGNIWIQ